MWCARVFHGAPDDIWEEVGVGEVELVDDVLRVFNENGDLLKLTLPSEGSSFILERPTVIQCDDKGIALSFAEDIGAESIWRALSLITGLKLQVEEVDSEFIEDFPFPAIDNLGNIATLVGIIGESRLESIVLGDDYQWLTALLNLEVRDGSHEHRFSIVTSLFNSHSRPVVEALLFKEFRMRILECLEYDSVHCANRDHHTHRNALDAVVFKEIVHINDDSITELIHQNYFTTYIKDVVLPVHLDEVGLAMLNEVLMENNVAIISKLSQDVVYLDELFGRGLDLVALKRGTQWSAANDRSLCDLFEYFRELFGLVRVVKFRIEDIFDVLVEHGILKLVEATLAEFSACEYENIWSHACFILTTIISFDVHNLTQNYILSRISEPSLLHSITSAFVPSELVVANCIVSQFSQLYQMIISTCSIPQSWADEYRNHVYDATVDRILEGALQIEPSFSQSICLVRVKGLLDLPSPPLVDRFIRVQFFVRLSSIIGDPAISSMVVLSAVQLLTGIIKHQEQVFLDCIERDRVLDSVVLRLGIMGSGAKNALYSSIMSLFLLIENLNIRTLIAALVEGNYQVIRRCAISFIAEKVKERYDRNEDPFNLEDSDVTCVTSGSEYGLAEWSSQLEEEKYFESNGGDDDGYIDSTNTETLDAFMERSTFAVSDDETELFSLLISRKRNSPGTTSQSSKRPKIKFAGETVD